MYLNHVVYFHGAYVRSEDTLMNLLTNTGKNDRILDYISITHSNGTNSKKTLSIHMIYQLSFTSSLKLVTISNYPNKSLICPPKLTLQVKFEYLHIEPKLNFKFVKFNFPYQS